MDVLLLIAYKRRTTAYHLLKLFCRALRALRSCLNVASQAESAGDIGASLAKGPWVHPSGA